MVSKEQRIISEHFRNKLNDATPQWLLEKQNKTQIYSGHCETKWKPLPPIYFTHTRTHTQMGVREDQLGWSVFLFSVDPPTNVFEHMYRYKCLALDGKRKIFLKMLFEIEQKKILCRNRLIRSTQQRNRSYQQLERWLLMKGCTLQIHVHQPQTDSLNLWMLSISHKMNLNEMLVFLFCTWIHLTFVVQILNTKDFTSNITGFVARGPHWACLMEKHFTRAQTRRKHGNTKLCVVFCLRRGEIVKVQQSFE